MCVFSYFFLLTCPILCLFGLSLPSIFFYIFIQHFRCVLEHSTAIFLLQPLHILCLFLDLLSKYLASYCFCSIFYVELLQKIFIFFLPPFTGLFFYFFSEKFYKNYKFILITLYPPLNA